MVLTRGVGDGGGYVRRFCFGGLVAEGVCGVFMPWVHGRWVLGLGACRAMRRQSWFGGSVAVLTTVVAAGGGRNFQKIDRTGILPQTERLTMPR